MWVWLGVVSVSVLGRKAATYTCTPAYLYLMKVLHNCERSDRIGSDCSIQDWDYLVLFFLRTRCLSLPVSNNSYYTGFYSSTSLFFLHYTHQRKHYVNGSSLKPEKLFCAVCCTMYAASSWFAGCIDYCTYVRMFLHTASTRAHANSKFKKFPNSKFIDSNDDTKHATTIRRQCNVCFCSESNAKRGGLVGLFCRLLLVSKK